MMSLLHNYTWMYNNKKKYVMVFFCKFSSLFVSIFLYLLHRATFVVKSQFILEVTSIIHCKKKSFAILFLIYLYVKILLKTLYTWVSSSVTFTVPLWKWIIIHRFLIHWYSCVNKCYILNCCDDLILKQRK